MPISQATHIVQRMEDRRAELHRRNQDVRETELRIKRLKEDLQAAEEWLPQIRNRAQEALTNFNSVVSEYRNAGTGWLKIEAVDAPDDIKAQQPPEAAKA